MWPFSRPEIGAQKAGAPMGAGALCRRSTRGWPWHPCAPRAVCVAVAAPLVGKFWRPGPNDARVQCRPVAVLNGEVGAVLNT